MAISWSLYVTPASTASHNGSQAQMSGAGMRTAGDGTTHSAAHPQRTQPRLITQRRRHQTCGPIARYAPTSGSIPEQSPTPSSSLRSSMLLGDNAQHDDDEDDPSHLFAPKSSYAHFTRSQRLTTSPTRLIYRSAPPLSGAQLTDPMLREAMGRSASDRCDALPKLRPPALPPTLPTGEPVNGLYMAHRARFAARNTCLSRAADVWRCGDGSAAIRFSKEGPELNVKIVSAVRTLVRKHSKFEEAVVRSRDVGGSDDDGGGGIALHRDGVLGVAGRLVCWILHGLHANEATDVLEELLLSLEYKHSDGLETFQLMNMELIPIQDFGLHKLTTAGINHTGYSRLTLNNRRVSMWIFCSQINSAEAVELTATVQSV
ncbi:hypothetical protein C8R43DRAFT_943565 [Mycena crocata]|nr:hypothetical protein C8R43DRAFT_943565 [Mycena crocata]